MVKALREDEVLMVPYWILIIASIVTFSPILLTLTIYSWLRIIGYAYAYAVVFALLWVQAKKLEIKANKNNPNYTSYEDIKVYDANIKEDKKGKEV